MIISLSVSAEEFEIQVTCLQENTEKYITKGSNRKKKLQEFIKLENML